MNTNMSYADKLKDLHDWLEPTTIEFKGKSPLWGVEETKTLENVEQCMTCGAIRRNGTIYYDDCSVMTIYPGGLGPCMCTKRKYFEAHGVKE